MSNSIEQNTLNINLKTLDYCIEEAFKLNKEEKDCVIIYLVESNDELVNVLNCYKYLGHYTFGSDKGEFSNKIFYINGIPRVFMYSLESKKNAKIPNNKTVCEIRSSIVVKDEIFDNEKYNKFSYETPEKIKEIVIAIENNQKSRFDVKTNVSLFSNDSLIVEENYIYKNNINSPYFLNVDNIYELYSIELYNTNIKNDK